MIVTEKPAPFICPDCGHTTEPIDHLFKREHWIMPSSCSVCRDQLIKTEEQIKILRTIDNMEAGYFYLLERGYALLQLSEADIEKVPLKLRTVLDSSSYINGPIGTGKTCLLTAATKQTGKNIFAQARAALEIPHLEALPRFADVSTLLRRFHAAIMGRGENGETYEYLMSLFTRCPSLILDDIGWKRSTEFTEDNLFEIIDARLNFQRLTFFTSNFTLAQLAERINPRTVSRIAQMCRGHVFYLGGVDRRLIAENTYRTP